jgi:hypothetical protein
MATWEDLMVKQRQTGWPGVVAWFRPEDVPEEIRELWTKARHHVVELERLQYQLFESFLGD